MTNRHEIQQAIKAGTSDSLLDSIEKEISSMDFMKALMMSRRITELFGFGGPMSNELFQNLKKLTKGKKIVFAGCGDSYNTHLMSGIATLVDDGSWESTRSPDLDVIRLDARTLDFSQYDVLMLEWPDRDPNVWSTETVMKFAKAQPNGMIVMIGENQYGASFADETWEFVTESCDEVPCEGKQYCVRPNINANMSVWRLR